MPPTSSLTTFANDGTIAWARSGARLIAVDPRSGRPVRSVKLEPAPFGVGWRVERLGAFFVVRDDHEIAAYDEATGARLWKRTGLSNVAFVGERKGRHISIVPEPTGEWVDIALADLGTGAFETKLRVDGTMKFVGTRGTLAGDLLFFATDERNVFAVDVARWEVAQCHAMDCTHVLPPVATASGVYVASIAQRSNRPITRVSTLDGVTGAILSSYDVPGAAHALSAGPNGLALEGRSSPTAPVERMSFRPETPHLRLIVAKHVDVLVRTDAPNVDPRRLVQTARVSGTIVPGVDGVPGRRSGERVEGERDELLPLPWDGSERRDDTPRQGLLGLLALLEAESAILAQIAEGFESRRSSLQLHALGITLRDPRARWSGGAFRDPCVLDLAENRNGDAIATYLYPAARSGKVPVVLVTRATGEARWLADDFDVWFAGVLHNALAHAPDAVRAALDRLALASDFPCPLPNAVPPPWFFEAHATTWTLADADAALAAGDVEGAERMLIAIGRTGSKLGVVPADVKDRLASVYATLGWDHHRATVVETW